MVAAWNATTYTVLIYCFPKASAVWSISLQCPYPVAVCEPEQAMVARSLPELEEKETTSLTPPHPHTSTPPPSTASNSEEWMAVGNEMNFDLVRGVAAQDGVTLDPTTEAMLDAIMSEIAQ